IHGQCPGDGAALLLAAGHLGRIGVGAFGQADPLEQRPGVLDGLLLRLAEHMHRCLDDVFQQGHVRPEVEVLEDHGESGTHAYHLFPVGRFTAVLRLLEADRLAVDDQVALVGLLEQVHAAQKGALAGAGGSDQGDHVALVGLERQPLEDFGIAEALGDVAHFQRNRG
ncbi:hypothetical protein AOR10_24605, partial [Vibrio alginolyticus]